MDDIKEQYEFLASSLSECSASLQHFLSTIVPQNIHVDRITARWKSWERLEGKANKKNADGSPKYKNPLSDIQDIIGARIIVLYLSEVEEMQREASNFLTMIEKVDKEPEGFSEFGYFGWHGIVRIPDEAKPNTTPEGFPKFFELQIKTIFQHAWAEAEHDLAYKQFRGELLREERRLIAYAAAQAWGADNSFAVVLQQLEERRLKNDS